MPDALRSRGFLRLASLLFFLFLLWIIYLADTGRQSLFFDLVHGIPGGDKIGHAGLYGLLALMTSMALDCRSLPWTPRHLPAGTALVGLFAVLEEMSQAFFATRTCDWTDLAADAVGLTVATLIARRLRGEAFRRN